MKTKEKTASYGGLFLTCLMVLGSMFPKITNASTITNKIAGDISESGIISFYIIGIILGLGITGFIIVSIIDKRREKYEKEHPTTNIHPISHHRHHHHQKVIKKSA